MPSYNSKEVTVIFQGKIIKGFADGSRINVSRNNPSVTMRKGGEDNHCYGMANDSSGQVVARLLQSSASNDMLTEQARLQELTGEGEGELFIKDNSGRSLHFCPNARLEGFPEVDYEQEVGVREWTFLCPQLSMEVKGN